MEEVNVPISQSPRQGTHEGEHDAHGSESAPARVRYDVAQHLRERGEARERQQRGQVLVQRDDGSGGQCACPAANVGGTKRSTLAWIRNIPALRYSFSRCDRSGLPRPSKCSRLPYTDGKLKLRLSTADLTARVTGGPPSVAHRYQGGEQIGRNAGFQCAR